MTDIALDAARFLYILLSAVTTGFAFVIWWIIKGLSSDVKAMRQELNVNMQACGEKFRTKKESESQWQQLNLMIAKSEAVATERHTQVWNKIDNQTKLFMQEKEYLTIALNGNAEKITRLEIGHEMLKSTLEKKSTQ